MRNNIEWNDLKAESNFKKPGVSFTEASTVFNDPLAKISFQTNLKEERILLIGHSITKKLLFVVYAEKNNSIIRIISARKATTHERKEYEEGI